MLDAGAAHAERQPDSSPAPVGVGADPPAADGAPAAQALPDPETQATDMAEAALERTGEQPAPPVGDLAGRAQPAMFSGFLTQETSGRAVGWLRRLMVVASLSVHAVALLIGVAYSMWQVDELSAPRVPVTFLTMPVAPPPPPAAKAARAAPKPRPRPTPVVVQPVTVAPVQPQPSEAETTADQDQAGEREGVEGGVTGGVAGAVLTSAAPPRMPELTPQQRQALIRRYLEEILRTRIASRLRLPPEAERMGVEGTVVMLLAIDGTGRLVGLRTAASCPHEILCEAAARTIREAAPFPPPPAALVGGLQAEMPLTYRLE